MKPVIAAIAAAFLLVSAVPVMAQTNSTTPPTTMQKKKGSSARAAVDCKKAENASNKACMDAAKNQASAPRGKKKNAPAAN